MTRFAVFSDVHSNVQALNSFINILRIEHSKEPFDRVIFLGDMLSYGPSPCSVIDCLMQLKDEFSIEFIIGNHDQLYFDLQVGQSSYYYQLPDFIKESVDYTLQLLDLNFEAEFDWLESFQFQNTFFSHANANSFGDWTYIRSFDDAASAALKVFQKECFVGVFGHVHRLMNERIRVPTVNAREVIDVRILNFGSVGQPRGEGSSFGIINFNGNKVSYETICFNYDKAPLIRSLSNCGFSQSTFDRLLGYYR